MSGTVHLGLSNPSLFTPPTQLPHTIHMFKDLVLKDLAKIPLKRQFHNPLPQAGLKSLCDNRDLGDW